MKGLASGERFCYIGFADAGIAQLVERNLAKVEVASSRLVSRSAPNLRGLLCTGFMGADSPQFQPLVELCFSLPL